MKGSDNLKEGQKYIKLDKLEETMKPYQSNLRTADDPKIKARLNYNLAIIHDILGDTNLAYQYAGKALLADDMGWADLPINGDTFNEAPHFTM